MALVGERDESEDGLVDFLQYPIRGVQAVSGYVLPDFTQVIERGGVQDVAAHEPLLRRSSLLRRSRSKASAPSMG